VSLGVVDGLGGHGGRSGGSGGDGGDLLFVCLLVLVFQDAWESELQTYDSSSGNRGHGQDGSGLHLDDYWGVWL
jgi:GTPase involved in cell partitioning and DNA repair